jgi:hypothetical protein
VTSSFKHGIEYSSYIKGGRFLEQLSGYQLLKKAFVGLCYLILTRYFIEVLVWNLNI